MKHLNVDMVHLALGMLLWVALLILAIDGARIRGRAPGDSDREGGKVLLFLALALVALCVWRAPVVLLDLELNRDESQYIAQAMKYTTDFLPWRSVDGATAGPLNVYDVMWPYLFGMRPTYLTERVTELFFIFLTIFFCQKAFAILVGRRRSLLAVFPLVTFYLFAHKPDFVQYCGEDFPNALLAAGLWLLLGTFQSPARLRLFVLGVLLGAVPFAKLQAGPLAGYLFVVAAGAVLYRAKRGGAEAPWAPLLSLAAGTLCMPAAILIPVAAGGVFPDFMTRYVLLGAHFRYPGSHRSVLGTFVELLHRGGEATLFLAGSAVWVAMGFGLLQKFGKRPGPAWYGGLALAIGYCLVGFGVVTRSSSIFRHYLLLLIVPAAVLACWIWRGFSLQGDGVRSDRAFARTALFVALCVAPLPLSYGLETLHYSFMHRPPGFTAALVDPHSQYIRGVQSGSFLLFRLDPHFDYASVPPGKVGINRVSAFLLQAASPGDRMAMWGALSRCFEETGMTPATRDTIGYFGLTGATYYPAGYLADMEQSKPRFFVDSVHAEGAQPDSWDFTQARHTTYAPLADYVAQNYVLMKEVPPETGGEPVLVFERKPAK